MLSIQTHRFDAVVPGGADFLPAVLEYLQGTSADDSWPPAEAAAHTSVRPTIGSARFIIVKAYRNGLLAILTSELSSLDSKILNNLVAVIAETGRYMLANATGSRILQNVPVAVI